MTSLINHKIDNCRLRLVQSRIRIILILVCLTFSASHADNLSRDQNCSHERGHCGGVVIIPTTERPLTSKERAPLEINAMFDAVIVGNTSETFNIQAGVNDHLEFEINGGTPFVIVLSAGGTLTAQNIADDLNGNSTFAGQAFAFKITDVVAIRSKGAPQGSIQLNSIANNAYSELGFTVGFVGPSMNSSEQAVILQAADDWEALIESTANLPNPYQIDFCLRPFDSDNYSLAGTANSYSMPEGVPLNSDIVFNSNETWFVDPTPWEDSEYNQSGTDGPNSYDMLTAARHEIGHAIGWVNKGSNVFDLLENTALTSDINANVTTIPVQNTAYFPSSGKIMVDEEIMRYSSKTANSFQQVLRGVDGTHASAHSIDAEVISGNVFDRTRLNIAALQFGAHTDEAEHINDLMNPAISMRVRKPISLYPSVSFLARAHNYDVIMRYVDVNHGGTELGSANNPWTTFDQANTNASNRHILMTPGIYTEPMPSYTAGSANTYLTTRIGSAAIKIQDTKYSTLKGR